MPDLLLPFVFAIAVVRPVATLPVVAEEPRKIDAIEYAEVDGHSLLLDLYLPGVNDAPLVVWIHGGAWRGGSRSKMPLGFLVEHGYAVASVDYRLSGIAKFPAQIHDCKAAIRFLRARTGEYGYDAQRIAVAGSSAGGHLVAELGVTNGNTELEGTVGMHTTESSDVQAVVDYYGPTNFMTILQQSTPHGLGVRVPALQMLIGDRPESKPELARLASPVFHVDKNDPPLLMIHGDQDPQVPINQSHELHAKYKENDLDVTFEVVSGGAHGGKAFFDAARRQLVVDFLDRTLSVPTTDHPAFQPVKDLFAAMSKHDGKAMRETATADFQLLEHGEDWTMKKLIDAVQPNGNPYERKNFFKPIRARQKGDVAWISYWNKAEILRENEMRTLVWLENATMIREDSRWKIQLLHSTRLEPDQYPHDIQWVEFKSVR